MDSFAEQLISKKSQKTDIALKILISIAGLSLAILFMTITFATGFNLFILLSVGTLYLTVRIISNMYTEYEYIVTNNDLDIDKIVGKRKRKRLMTIKLDTVKEFEMYTDRTELSAETTVIAVDGTVADAYYLIAEHSTHGKTVVIFNPNERMREAINSGLPYAIRKRINIEKDDTE